MLKDALRQAKGVETLSKDIAPTSEAALEVKGKYRSRAHEGAGKHSLQERRDLQCDLLCGQGFDRTLSTRQVETLVLPRDEDVAMPDRPSQPEIDPMDTVLDDGGDLVDFETSELEQIEPPAAIESSTITQVRFQCEQLFVTNWMKGGDKAYISRLLHKVSLEDQLRFHEYLASRPLGIAIFTAGPGFGKTYIQSIATLLMAEREGCVLASGPSNSAVNNFAARLFQLESEAIEVYNLAKSDASDRRRKRLIVRAYKPRQEAKAFFNMLRFGRHVQDRPDQASGNGKWNVDSPWHFNLSTAQWLLAAFGSRLAARPIKDEDKQILHDLRLWLDNHRAQCVEPKWFNLAMLIRGEISWDDFDDLDNEYKPSHNDIIKQMARIWRHADILCVTPSASHSVDAFREWKSGTAQGVAIDEAANMGKADLITLWGNW